jgi:hypothetical protein
VVAAFLMVPVLSRLGKGNRAGVQTDA